MCDPGAGFDNRLTLMQANGIDTRELTTEIAALLDSPAAGAEAPSLSALEDTLTTGYARALALEAERDRIEHRLTAVERDDAELLRVQLERVQHELTELRRILVPLRSRASAVRALDAMQA